MFIPVLEDELEQRQKDFDVWVEQYLAARTAIEVIRQREAEPKTSLAKFLFSRQSAGNANPA